MWKEKREFDTSAGTSAEQGCSCSAAVAAADYVAVVGNRQNSGTVG